MYWLYTVGTIILTSVFNYYIIPSIRDWMKGLNAKKSVDQFYSKQMQVYHSFQIEANWRALCQMESCDSKEKFGVIYDRLYNKFLDELKEKYEFVHKPQNN